MTDGRDCSCSRRLRCARSSAASSPSNDVDFTIPRGSIVSLIGPNGAGKTTFFNMITGVYKPTSGAVVFDGEDITRQAAAHDHRARHRAHVPEHPALPGDDGARERARRHALPAQGRHPRRASSDARRAGARSARPGSGRASCSRTAASPGVEDELRAQPLRTATSGGSRSRARSRRSRSCCCSTSRPRA